MAKISIDQLSKLSPANLKPVYLISGDEALLVQESRDSIRVLAKKAGHSEREQYYTDAGFQWPQLLQSANSMSLFADKKLIEVNIHNGKPGDAGSKAIQEYCRTPADENLLLLTAPKLDRSAQNSKWYKAIDSIGGIITIWPINEKQLPRWIDQRLLKAGIRADSQAVDILAERVEGNLLAASQEIEKLKLIATDGVVNAQTMASAVVDSARYDVFSLVDKALSGHAKAAAITLNGLRGEGNEPIAILWIVTREVRTLIALREAHKTGANLSMVARKHGVFDNRLPLLKAAIQRLNPNTLRLLLKECAYTDRTIKGMASGDPWSIILDILLTLAGTRCLNSKNLQMLIK